MPMIHRIVDDIQGLPEEEGSPMGAAIEELLGGERGSVPDLAARFLQCHRGHIMASWLGDGPYETIAPGDLRYVLGAARVDDLATLAGLASEDFLFHLARLLPAAVHRKAQDTLLREAETGSRI